MMTKPEQMIKDISQAILIQCGEDVKRFRPGTPSCEVLESLQRCWRDGRIKDHEDYEVTPSSPPLNPGWYTYELVRRHDELCYQACYENSSPIHTRQKQDKESLENAKAECKRKWRELWSMTHTVKCKMS